MKKDDKHGSFFFLDVKWVRYSAALTGAVFTKAALIFLGYLGGSWVDRKMGTSPLFMFVFIVAGFS